MEQAAQRIFSWTERGTQIRSGKRESPNILKGDVVLVQDDDLKRGMWKMAIVEDLIVGKDGVVRGAKLRKAR